MNRKCWSNDDRKKLEYFFSLSQIHQIDFENLVKAVVDAEKVGGSRCGGLTIQFRARTERGNIFLITANQRVVAQIRLEKRIVKRMIEEGLSCLPKALNRRVNEGKEHKKRDRKIADLHVGMKGVGLKAEVTQKSPLKRVYSRFTSETLNLVTITVKDKTGSIQMGLWNDQIDSVSVGDMIQVGNARVGQYRGVKQLLMNKKSSTLNVLEKPTPIVILPKS
jgi:hypothetical protein